MNEHVRLRGINEAAAFFEGRSGNVDVDDGAIADARRALSRARARPRDARALIDACTYIVIAALRPEGRAAVGAAGARDVAVAAVVASGPSAPPPPLRVRASELRDLREVSGMALAHFVMCEADADAALVAAPAAVASALAGGAGGFLVLEALLRCGGPRHAAAVVEAGGMAAAAAGIVSGSRSAEVGALSVVSGIGLNANAALGAPAGAAFLRDALALAARYGTRDMVMAQALCACFSNASMEPRLAAAFADGVIDYAARAGVAGASKPEVLVPVSACYMNLATEPGRARDAVIASGGVAAVLAASRAHAASADLKERAIGLLANVAASPHGAAAAAAAGGARFIIAALAGTELAAAPRMVAVTYFRRAAACGAVPASDVPEAAVVVASVMRRHAHVATVAPDGLEALVSLLGIAPVRGMAWVVAGVRAGVSAAAALGRADLAALADRVTGALT